jgi:hypothetical protein
VEQLFLETGTAGITLERLAWAQRYLRGELLTVGPLQFELRPFFAPMRVHRSPDGSILVAHGLNGRPIDLRSGIFSAPRDAPELRGWELMLEPGAPILEMWIPGPSAMVPFPEAVACMRSARAIFERLAPETLPLGVAGESWRLDPQVREFLPYQPGVHDIQEVCALFPSELSEERTVRRLFGPDAARVRLPRSAPPHWSPVQRAVAAFLARPGTRLSARGGFILNDELERRASASPA